MSLYSYVDIEPVGGKSGWLLAALFCACSVFAGCAAVPSETAQPSINPPAVDYCRRNPGSSLCL